MLTKQMRTGKCWFEKGDFDHFGMCFGCFRAHFGPGGVPKTAPARHFGPGGSLKQPQHVKKVRCALANAGLKRVILTILGCVLGVFGLILDQQPQHVKKAKNNADQKYVHWKMLI